MSVGKSLLERGECSKIWVYDPLFIFPQLYFILRFTIPNCVYVFWMAFRNKGKEDISEYKAEKMEPVSDRFSVMDKNLDTFDKVSFLKLIFFILIILCSFFLSFSILLISIEMCLLDENKYRHWRVLKKQ